jgi:hypothetical protein
MSQEFHVMRPKIFFTGKFKRTIQRIPGFENKGKIIGAYTMSDGEAIDTECKVSNLVKKYSGTEFSYQKDEICESIQFKYDKWHHVRSFAAYNDYPFRKFLIFGRHQYQKPLLPEQSPAVMQTIETKRSSSPNIVISKDNKGFFFPCDIKTPIETKWGYIGSSINLKKEVNNLKILMEKEGYWHSDIDEFIGNFNVLCDSSIKTGYPIIIDG